MNPNFLFHIALPLCAFIAGITAGIVIYRGRLRDAISQLTLTNAYLEAERELKREEANKAAEALIKLRQERANWSTTREELEDTIKSLRSKLAAVGVIRDPKTGRFVNPKKMDEKKAIWSTIANAFNDPDVVKLCDEIKSNAVNDVTPKTHTLRHGMTVKDPTPEQAKEIFEEARRLGIDVWHDSLDWPAIWYSPISAISGCAIGNHILVQEFTTPAQFLAHMRGEA